MNSNNIYNAFHVVTKTYENVQKLINYCQLHSMSRNYVQAVNKPLRYKSDSDTAGWLIQDLIILYQHIEDPELDNGWRNGPIYALELQFYDPMNMSTAEATPSVYVSRYNYKDIESWSIGCSPTNHWRFYDALHDKNNMNIKQKDSFITATPKTQDFQTKLWGLEKVESYHLSFDELTADKALNSIFGGFDNLCS